VRLFVALDPPESVKDSLADLQTGLPEARWTDIDHLHLTLRFIGEVDAARAGEIVEALDLLEAPAVTLVPRS
jgi:2'-5' RNA ligase